jgi:hypothetical protein
MCVAEDPICFPVRDVRGMLAQVCLSEDPMQELSACIQDEESWMQYAASFI